MLEFLNGKKTYLVTIATLGYALGGWYLGYVPSEVAIPMIFGALGLGSLRHGVAKAGH